MAMAKFEENLRDSRTQRVLGFFIAKGLLIGEEIPPRGDVKLKLDDVFWVGEHVEPRVFEVLPAAMIHHPRTFIGRAGAPEELTKVIEAIKRDTGEGPDFKGMRYRSMRKWAKRATKDKRTKPLREIKRNKTMRLSPTALTALEEGAERAGVTQTQYLEHLLVTAAASTAG